MALLLPAPRRVVLIPAARRDVLPTVTVAIPVAVTSTVAAEARIRIAEQDAYRARGVHHAPRRDLAFERHDAAPTSHYRLAHGGSVHVGPERLQQPSDACYRGGGGRRAGHGPVLAVQTRG